MSGGLRDAGLQKPVNRRLGEVLGGAGVSTMGNTAGTTGTVLGPVFLVGVSGVSLSQSTRGNRATISIAASAENGVAIGAGTQTQLTGTVIFSNSNGVTFGLSNGTLTASAAGGGVGLSAGTQQATSGTVVFSNSNGIAFGLSNSSVLTASYSQSTASAVAVAAGTQTATSGTVVFSNSNGIAFGLSNSSVLTASYTQSTGPAALAAGTQTGSSGTFLFSNSNGVSFGLSGSTRITASHNAVSELAVGDGATGTQVNQGIPRLQFNTSNNVIFGKSVNANTFIITAQAQAVAAAAGTQTATSGTVVFSNSNGIAFGLSNSSVLTASYSQSTASAVAVAAGTQTATSGTVVFSNSNGMSFGLSNSSVLTASYTQSTGPAALAAGTQTGSSGTFAFANSAIEFGMSGSSQITAQPKRVSYLVNNGYDRGVFLGDVSSGTVFVFPWYIYAPISATRIDFLLAISNSSSAGGTVSVDFALYSLNGSTANALSAVARSFAYNSTLGASSSYTQVSGTRYRSIGLGAGFNVTPGQYLGALLFKVTTALTSGTYQAFGGRDVSVVANEYPTALGTAPAYWNGGFYSASSTALPNPLQLSEVFSTGSNDVVFVPFLTMAGSF